MTVHAPEGCILDKLELMASDKGGISTDRQNYRRHRQRAVRLGCSAIKTAKQTFDDTAMLAFEQLNYLANCRLQQLSIRNMPLGMLTSLPSLLTHSIIKVQQRQKNTMQDVRSALQAMEGAVQAMSSIVEEIRAHTCALDMDCKHPVFATLSSTFCLHSFQIIRDMYAAELELKFQVCDAICNMPTGNISAYEDAEQFARVYLELWRANSHVDEGKVMFLIGLLDEDMNGF